MTHLGQVLIQSNSTVGLYFPLQIPCILDVGEILGPQSIKKLEAKPISDNTIQKRIVDKATESFIETTPTLFAIFL